MKFEGRGFLMFYPPGLGAPGTSVAFLEDLAQKRRNAQKNVKAQPDSEAETPPMRGQEQEAS